MWFWIPFGIVVTLVAIAVIGLNVIIFIEWLEKELKQRKRMPSWAVIESSKE